jgi:putative ABC transport system permease protein
MGRIKTGIPMPASMPAKIDKIPGVLSAEPYRKIYITYDGRRVLLEMIDVALRMSYCCFQEFR